MMDEGMEYQDPEETPEPEVNRYPVFIMNADGEVVVDDIIEEPVDPDGTVPPYTVDVGEGEYLVIPGDGSTVVIQQPDSQEPSADYSDKIDAIQSDIAYLAAVQASNYGYLGSQALDTFDRVVQQNSYRYYCAFRDGSDTYNGVLYLSDSISRNGNTVVMEGALQVRVYRTYSGNTYYYYYSSASAGDVSVNLSGNLMYYTNCADNYPTLGGISTPYRYPSWVMPVLLVGLLAAFFCWRSKR